MRQRAELPPFCQTKLLFEIFVKAAVSVLVAVGYSVQPGVSAGTVRGTKHEIVVVRCEYLFSLGLVEERLSQFRAVIYFHFPRKALLYFQERPVGLIDSACIIPAVELFVFDMVRQRIVLYPQPAGSLCHSHRLVVAVGREGGMIMDIRRDKAEFFNFHLFTFSCSV